MKESIERRIYREKCKHFLPGNELCCMKSGGSNGYHLSIGCNGKCPRMKRYDKKRYTIKINDMNNGYKTRTKNRNKKSHIRESLRD